MSVVQHAVLKRNVVKVVAFRKINAVLGAQTPRSVATKSVSVKMFAVMDVTLGRNAAKVHASTKANAVAATSLRNVVQEHVFQKIHVVLRAQVENIAAEALV